MLWGQVLYMSRNSRSLVGMDMFFISVFCALALIGLWALSCLAKFCWLKRCIESLIDFGPFPGYIRLSRRHVMSLISFGHLSECVWFILTCSKRREPDWLRAHFSGYFRFLRRCIESDWLWNCFQNVLLVANVLSLWLSSEPCRSVVDFGEKAFGL